MNKPLLLGAAVLALAPAFGAYAHTASAVSKAPPAEPYKEVSSLVQLPSFIPGMGQLFVDPSTLPAGPFLAYDRDGKLVSTIYMIPTAQMTPQMHLDNLLAPGGHVDHVDMMYNAGHPGVPEPHIHIILWHVPVDGEARVEK
ncbi:DUF5602 domain-containing protein [Achromobacter sp. F4_2707]|uniref:DUF5602 domain-containing protein n=1 Tax=Achromobacter sp. F4_2707 TaxID=3114286 RepID=UPI0039C5CB69